MIMETNNQSRVQKSQELANHKMVAMGLTTNDLDVLIDSAHLVSSAVAKQANTFAQIVTLQCDAKVERETVFGGVRSAWSAVKSADKENSPAMRSLFLEENKDQLVGVASFLADEVAGAYDRALEGGPVASDVKRLFKEKLATRLAQRLNVIVPVFKTKEERDREAVVNLEAKAAQLRNTYNL